MAEKKYRTEEEVAEMARMLLAEVESWENVSPEKKKNLLQSILRYCARKQVEIQERLFPHPPEVNKPEPGSWLRKKTRPGIKWAAEIRDKVVASPLLSDPRHKKKP